MKRMRYCMLAGLFGLLGGINSVALAQSSIVSDSLTLIAHYPLKTDANDAMGAYGPMTLVNAPFEEGGVRLSGIFIHAVDPADAAHAITPHLDALNMDAFAISATFKVAETGYPILIGGDSWRWMGAWVFSDSTLYMEANGYSFIERSQGRVEPNVSYILTMTYNAAEQRGRWYLNDVEIGSVAFALEHSGDKNFGSTHFGLGNAFKGILSDVKVYSYTGTPTAVEEEAVPTSIHLAPNYPNPFNPQTVLSYSLSATGPASLRVYDMLGREVAVLVDQAQAAGTHRVTFEGTGLPSGVYLYRLQAGAEVQTRRMLLMK